MYGRLFSYPALIVISCSTLAWAEVNRRRRVGSYYVVTPLVGSNTSLGFRAQGLESRVQGQGLEVKQVGQDLIPANLSILQGTGGTPGRSHAEESAF
jgi:hypothetical protein